MYVIRGHCPSLFADVLFALPADRLAAHVSGQSADCAHSVLRLMVAPRPWPLLIGISLAVVVGSVIFGGLQRVANVAIALLPTMVIIYLLMTSWVVVNHLSAVPVF